MLALYFRLLPQSSHGQVDHVSRIGVVLRECRECGKRGKRPPRRRRGDGPAWMVKGGGGIGDLGGGCGARAAAYYHRALRGTAPPLLQSPQSAARHLECGATLGANSASLGRQGLTLALALALTLTLSLSPKP